LWCKTNKSQASKSKGDCIYNDRCSSRITTASTESKQYNGRSIEVHRDKITSVKRIFLWYLSCGRTQINRHFSYQQRWLLRGGFSCWT
jgi:hypothetical protein